MTKKNEFNTGMNNSSALVAPSRSEIRINVTLPVINFRKILSKVLSIVITSSTVRVYALASACALSFIYMLEFPVSVALVIFIGVTCVVTSLFTFFGILKELGGFQCILNDVNRED